MLNKISEADVENLGITNFPEWEQQHIIRVINAYIKISSKKESFRIIYELIRNHNMQLTRLIRVFGVSVSGYYKWLNAQNSDIGPIKQRNKDLIKSIYHNNNHHIGCRKIQQILETQYNIKLNYKTINLYMNELGLCRECDKIKHQKKNEILHHPHKNKCG
ncbi:IS3 family transposase [Ureaplasma canigenitalium]|uniref:IS3 family transposase n=1 Tax=Ureaplasma canigenitalium TaxID=42092 RepID=UPI000689F155|nr:IS3 family transposase [Ureaplasma canigenitalium]